jgi:quercetin dioxygenase-like cupin family protein
MDQTRRDWALLVPALLAAEAARPLTAATVERTRLPSTVRKFEDLPIKTTGQNQGRSVFDGLNRSGVEIEIHETALAPGLMSHPPHRHRHVELVLLREGTLEVTIDGNTSTLNPGSIAYFASDCLHNAKNIGSKHAQYFVMSLDKDKDESKESK